MTQLYLSNGIYTCLAADTKSTTNVPTGSILFELDTGKRFYLTGGAWVNNTSLGDIGNVNLTGLGNGMALKWDTATSKWIVYTPGSGGTGGDVYLANSQVFTGVNTFDQRQIWKALAATPASPAAGYTTVYAKTKDVNNEGIFAKIKLAGTVSEVELGVADEVLSLTELSDVTLTSPADKHVVIYDNGTAQFVNRLLATADLPTINATTNTITDTSAATGDILRHNGTKFVRLARGSANQVLTTNAGATDIVWAAATGGGGGGGDVYLANANVFTNVQKISVDNGTQITFYRPVNTAGFGAGFSYDFNNSSAAEVNYGQQYVSLEVNTAGAHRGDFNIQLAVAATLGIRFRVFTSGSGGIIFGNNQRIQIDETGLTAARIFTLPDSAGELGVTTATQTHTNKTLVAASNTITDTSATTGDILRHNGTRFVRMARGTGWQVLATNSGGTDIAWTTLASGHMPANAVFNDQLNTYSSGMQSFQSSNFKILNPLGTFGYVFVGSALTTSNKNVTLPLLTANDTMAVLDFGQVFTNKTTVLASNTVTDTSAATGDITRHNGTRFVRMARGTALQVLRTNSGGTDIEYASLNSENAGTALASGNGSTTTFNVAHGLGSTPYMAHIQCSTHTNTFTYTYDATNIIVVFGTAPPSGTNNVKFQFRAIL